MIKFGDYITPEEYMGLRKVVGWVEFPLEQAKACIDKAYFVICVRDDDKAIGVVRLLWDGGYIAFLSDVIVAPEYQGQGIGRKLVEFCIDKLKEDMKPGYKVKLTLNSAKDKEHFYEKFGFKIRPNEDAGPGMDQWLIADDFVKSPEDKSIGSGVKIISEDDELKISGSVDLGYIGKFSDSQIEIDGSLEEIREWDIVSENLEEDCSDDELIGFLNKYFNDFIDKLSRNIENVNGAFLLHVFIDMDSCECNFTVIDDLFIEDKLFYGNEEDIAEIYNPVRDGLYNLSPYLETPNDGSIPKGHIMTVLRSFYPMFNFDAFLSNIVPEYLTLCDGQISFQCSDDYDGTILCGAYAVIDEDLSISDWHNF